MLSKTTQRNASTFENAVYIETTCFRADDSRLTSNWQRGVRCCTSCLKAESLYRSVAQLERAKYLAKRVQFLACTATSCAIRDAQVLEYELQNMIRNPQHLRPKLNVRVHGCTQTARYSGQRWTWLATSLLELKSRNKAMPQAKHCLTPSTAKL